MNINKGAGTRLIFAAQGGGLYFCSTTLWRMDI